MMGLYHGVDQESNNEQQKRKGKLVASQSTLPRTCYSRREEVLYIKSKPKMQVKLLSPSYAALLICLMHHNTIIN